MTNTIDITLREHFEAVLAERDARYSQQFESLRAINDAQQLVLQTTAKSMEAQMKRSEETTQAQFTAVTTARRVGDDLMRTMMPRAEAEQRDAALADKILATENRADRINARMDLADARGRGLSAGWTFLAMGIGVLTSIVTAIYAISRLSAIAP